MRIEKILSMLTDLLYPRRCPVCNEIVVPKGNLICPDCVRKLSFVKEPSCKKCGKEITDRFRELCWDCAKHRRSFVAGKALLNYNDTAKASMAKIKYGNKREYMDFYSEALCLRYGKLIERIGPDVLVLVPVHPSRKRQRGFNQAQILADKIGRKLEIPVKELIKRDRKTKPQKELNPAQRLKNLEAAFQAQSVPLDVKTILLIDDIYTTGSTIEACTRALLKEKADLKVYFLAVCIGRGS